MTPTSAWLLTGALFLYFLGAAISIATLITRRRERVTLIPALTLGGFALHIAGLALAGWSEGGLPLANIRGILFLLAWAAISVHLIAHFRLRVEVLGTVILTLVVLLMLTSLLIPDSPDAAGPEASPSLRTAGRLIHVLPGILGVGALFLTFAASLVYLAQDRALKARKPLTFFLRLPSLEQCERLAHQSLAWGFSFLSFSVITGIISTTVRADGSWGILLREKWSILAWLIFAIIIYDRIFTGGWRGRKAAYLSIIGFGVILLRMVGV